MFLYLYRGFTKEKGKLSMIGQKLFNAAVTMARKTAPKQAAIRTFSRTIASKGNGQQRVIVSGFGGPNLNADTHFKMLDYMRKFNYRPVVKGFNYKLMDYKPMIAKPLTGRPGTGQVKFFSQGRNIRMSRHVVYDFQPPRIAVQGFSNEVQKGVKVVGEPLKPSVTLPKREELIAQERVVIQGFGGDASKSVYKKMDSANTEARKVIRGFC